MTTLYFDINVSNAAGSTCQTGVIQSGATGVIELTGEPSELLQPIIDSITVDPPSGPLGTLFTVTVTAHDPSPIPATLSYSAGPIRSSEGMIVGTLTTTASPNIFTWQSDGVPGFSGSASVMTFLGSGTATIGAPTGLASGYGFNTYTITGDAGTTSTGSGSIDGWRLNYDCGGSTLKGARQAFFINSEFLSASSATNLNRNYVSIVATENAKAPDGGTNTGEDAKGAFFSLNLNARAYNGATNLAGVTGCEADVYVETGATTRGRFGYTAVSWGDVNGASYDAAYAIATANGVTTSWKVGILIGKTYWGTSPPIASDGAVMATDGASSTVATGIDLSSMTITGDFLKGPNGFAVGGDGKITGDMSLFTITADGKIVLA